MSGIFQLQQAVQKLCFSSSIHKVAFPTPPKQPSSAFLKFLERKRVDLFKSEPGIKGVDVVRQAAAAWQGLPIAEKKAYKEKYKDEYAQYRRLKENWWSSLTEQQRTAYSDHLEEVKKSKDHRELRKKLRNLGKPKRPLTAFNYFISRSDRKGLSQKEAFANITKSWKTLSNAEKKSFVELAEKDSKRYEDEMSAWEVKMMAEGHEELLRHSSKALKKNHNVPSEKSDRHASNEHGKVELL